MYLVNPCCWHRLLFRPNSAIPAISGAWVRYTNSHHISISVCPYIQTSKIKKIETAITPVCSCIQISSIENCTTPTRLAAPMTHYQVVLRAVFINKSHFPGKNHHVDSECLSPTTNRLDMNPRKINAKQILSFHLAQDRQTRTESRTYTCF